jgi:hypothetical protein
MTIFERILAAGLRNAQIPVDRVRIQTNPRLIDWVRSVEPSEKEERATTIASLTTISDAR